MQVCNFRLNLIQNCHNLCRFITFCWVMASSAHNVCLLPSLLRQSNAVAHRETTFNALCAIYVYSICKYLGNAFKEMLHICLLISPLQDQQSLVLS